MQLVPQDCLRLLLIPDQVRRLPLQRVPAQLQLEPAVGLELRPELGQLKRLVVQLIERLHLEQPIELRPAALLVVRFRL